MKISDFRHRITFQEYVTTEDELGQQIGQWVDVHTCWAAIKTIQGREYVAAGAERNEGMIRFVVRYTPGISPTMRISYKGRIFDINFVVNDDERNKTMTIFATEQVIR
ncbi:phage head closure protein [Staphylospora marina]|uniref:phage head closure protein n=1 Tax=Staphylospora marina TaxID=2490858 RepID=UPI000F5C1C5E|nr:phage head closure protein [Staphylospora marina]